MQNRASKVPTTLAPLSYAKLAKVGDKPNPILLAIISITPSKFEFLFIEQANYDRCSQVIENIEVIALGDFSGNTWCVLIGFIPR